MLIKAEEANQNLGVILFCVCINEQVAKVLLMNVDHSSFFVCLLIRVIYFFMFEFTNTYNTIRSGPLKDDMQDVDTRKTIRVKHKLNREYTHILD